MILAAGLAATSQYCGGATNVASQATSSGSADQSATAAAPTIGIVDMIPESLSHETNQDSEPFLAVSLKDPKLMAASAFTPDPIGPGSATAPIFVTLDGGRSWTLNSIIPSPVRTGDITHAFDEANLYTGILRASDGHLIELMTKDFTSSDLMTTQSSRPDNDQPFVRAIANNGKAFVYVGNNDTSQSVGTGKTATVDVSDNGGVSYKSIRIESRQTADISGCTIAQARQDGPSVRPTVAKDGTVYVAHFGWRRFVGDCGSAEVTTDVVVSRDDSWATGPGPFKALKDPEDHLDGIRVAKGVSVQWMNDESLGHERTGSTLTLAVDPKNSKRIFVAWADGGTAQQPYTIHVRHSVDKGVTWGQVDLTSKRNATNAALAVADNGTVAMLFQELVDSATGRRWKTHLLQTRDDFAHVDDVELANTPADDPVPDFLPYLGDYVGLTAVGDEFRGVFSASNFPDPANFKNVQFQRLVDLPNKKLLDRQRNEVPVSIDPFYFHITVKQ